MCFLLQWNDGDAIMNSEMLCLKVEVAKQVAGEIFFASEKGWVFGQLQGHYKRKRVISSKGGPVRQMMSGPRLQKPA